MKRYYDISGDIFIVFSIFCFGLAAGMKILGIVLPLGLSILYPSTLLKGSVYLLLLSIALNVQDLAKK